LQRIPRSALAGAVAFLVALALSRLHSTPYDNYVLLARALLDGRTWISWPGPYIDALPYQGHYYVIEGPLPALLLLPFVGLFGLANQTLLAVVLTGVAIGAAWQLGENLGVRTASNLWLCAFLLCGTDLLWCAIFGDVWFTAHVSAACFTLLALAELTGRRRAWLVALWAACAFESRFSLVLAVPVYLYVLLSASGEQRERLRTAGAFLAVMIPVAILWLLYNESRWGTWNDIGYTAWYHQDQVGMPTGSPFRLGYLGYQLQSFFVQLPQWLGRYPWIVPTYSGVALTWTSPALVLALVARRPLNLVVALWIAALLAAGPNFLYYVNGFAQFGMRHALDFEPFLLALVMLAVPTRIPRWGVALIVYSIVVGLWGCWFWMMFVRPS
jgi:drug/metabolite transporter superfamily protein YnfA